METESVPSSDEKLMSALAHILGIIVAFIVWALQKDKSRFVRFQTLQAMAFDAVVMVASMFTFFCLFAVLFIGMFGSMFSMMNNPASIEDVGVFFLFPSMMPLFVFACVFPFSFAVLVVRLIAAASVLNGRDFRYPILGRKVEEFLKG